MKKITSIFIALFASLSIMGQIPAFFNTNVNGGGNSFPLANATTSRKVQWFIPPGSLGLVPSGNNITAVYFQCSVGGTNTYPNLTVKLKTGSGTGLTGVASGPVEPGMTTVYSGVNVLVTATAGNWIQIILQTPFLYNPTLPLIVELEHSATNTSGPTLCQAVSIPGPGNGRQWADYNVANITGVGTQQINFGIDVIPATPCTGTPPPNAVVSTTAPICPNATTQLSLSTTYSLSNITYSWSASTTSSLGPWFAVPNSSNTILSSPQLTTNTWFQLTAACNGFGSTVIATPAQVTVSPVYTGNVPYYESFEGIQSQGQLPNCSWSSTGGNAQTYTSAQTNNRVPRTGNKYASVYGYNLAGTSYYYTHGIQLYPGVTYSASLFYTTEYYGYTNFQELSIKLGTSQSPTGLVNIATQSVAVSPVYKQLANTFTVATAGLYYVAVKVVSAANSQYAYYLTWDDLSITIPCNFNTPAVAATAVSTTVCAGSPAVLTATGANTYTWNTGANTSTISEMPTSSFAYVVAGTNTLTNCSATATNNIIVNPTPVVSIVPSATAVCEGSSVNLAALGAGTYTWSNNGSTSSIINVSPSVNTLYSVSGAFANSNNNCTGTTSQMITVNALPAVTAQNVPASSCAGQNVTLTGGGALSFEWLSTSGYIQGSPVIVNPNANTTYSVTGTDANGCEKTITISQSVSACVGIHEQSSGISGLNVYPNPTSGEFTVELLNAEVNTVEVMDVTGRVLSSQTNNQEHVTINVSTLAAGVYYLKVITSGATDVVKIVKQ